MEKLMAAAHFRDGKIIDIDGMRVDFVDGWGLVRASNTMPALVLRFEANTTEALKRIKSEFKQLFTKVKPDITLPF
jgi:phosphomannomutase/phosphoglucomutase